MPLPKFVTDHVGNVLSWTDPGGRKLLHPAFGMPEGRLPGGLYLDAPISGEVAQTPAWRGVKLPNYGIIRGLSRLYPVISDHEGNSRYRSFEMDIEAREAYQWSFRLHSRINLAPNGHALDYQFKISRNERCRAVTPMPLAYGLQSYFPTTGKKWSVYERGQVLIDSGTEVNTERIFDLKESLVYLQVDQGIYWLRLQGYDQVVVWSDQPDKYICLKPKAGIRKDISLRPNSWSKAWCRIEFVPAY